MEECGDQVGIVDLDGEFDENVGVFETRLL